VLLQSATDHQQVHRTLRLLLAGAAAASVFSNSSFGNTFFPTGNPFLIQQEVLATISVQVGTRCMATSVCAADPADSALQQTCPAS
jgi:hypothetical protein